MARRKDVRTRPDRSLEERAANANLELDAALRHVKTLRAERTRVWDMMFNANGYTQRGVATISNRLITPDSEAWATDDAVEKALLRLTA
jgi:50S ribosomal subunit-associated GTPase HflX